MTYEQITAKMKAFDDVIELALAQVLSHRTQEGYDKITAARELRLELAGMLATAE